MLNGFYQVTARKTIDFEAIKQAAAGRWSSIIAALTPLSAEVLTKGKADTLARNVKGLRSYGQ